MKRHSCLKQMRIFLVLVGTAGVAAQIHALGLRGGAIVADFNADGHRDIIVPEYVSASFETGLTVYPGNGDFTFGPAARLLTPSQFARDGISGDFNRDGRRDFAGANEWTFDGAIYEIQGLGADIWGTSDAFRFAYNRFSSSGPLFVSHGCAASRTRTGGRRRA